MGTTVFDALDNLVDVIATAVAGVDALATVEVFDGGPVTDVPLDAVHVGWEPRDAVAADGTQQKAQGWGNGRDERFDIPLTVYTESGDNDELTARSRAKLIYHTVEAAVRDDTTLGGVVEQTIMGGRILYRQMQTDRGLVCELQFTVRIQAFPDNP